MTTTKITGRKSLGLAAMACAMASLLVPQAFAQSTDQASAQQTTVSAADFQKLQDAVAKLSQQVQQLQQANSTQQQTHQEDLDQIKRLQDQVDQTQQTAQDAEKKSTAVAQSQEQGIQAPLDEATVNHNFQMLGDAEFQYIKSDNQHGTFYQADFAPIFLYRAGDNILFEAGFDTTLQNNDGGGYSTTFNLSFAQLDFVINDYVTLATGELLIPLGTYAQRGAGWLNKIPDDPLAVDGLLPSTEVGGMLQGAIPVGNDGKFFNYAVYGVNGPSSTDTSADATSLDLHGNVGSRSDGIDANLHPDPSAGGRIGFFLPFPKPHTDLEVGVSGQTGEWDNTGNYNWSAGVFDAALHLGPNFELKGEYIKTWYGTDNMGEIRQDGWWVQGAYKLAGLPLDLPIIRNTELVARYDSLNDGLGTNTQRETAGFIYYFTNTLLLEGDYEWLNTDNLNPNQNPTGNLILQLSLGF
jgi:hypothetical protein